MTVDSGTAQATEILKTEKKPHAKTASLWGQIIAALWVGGWNAAQFVKDLIAGRPLDPIAVIVSGLAIAACFTPVYFNLLMDKIREIKLGA